MTYDFEEADERAAAIERRLVEIERSIGFVAALIILIIALATGAGCFALASKLAPAGFESTAGLLAATVGAIAVSAYLRRLYLRD